MSTATEEKVDKRKIPKAERGRPTTGQHAKIDKLPYEDLNKREKKLLTVLDGDGQGKREPYLIPELKPLCFPSEGKQRGMLLVRNACRRLVAADWIEHTDKTIDVKGEPVKLSRGVYRISESGRKRLKRALSEPAEPKAKEPKEPKGEPN